MANEKSFGAQLKDAREASGDTLDAIARTTRISRRYLQALEASDLQSLPGSAFDKGYIRAYSEFVGIDPQPILDAYHLEERRLGRGTPENARRTIEEMSRLVDRGAMPSTKRRAALAVALALGLAAAAAWWSRTRDVENQPVSSSEIETASSRSTPILSIPERPVSRPSPLKPSSPTTSEQGLVVADHGVGTGISGRDLVGRSDRFSEGTDAFFWTRVVGGSSGQIIRHVWFYEGRVIMRAELIVGSAHWRTFSRVTLPPGSAGTWWVEARTADGRLLAREEFECRPHIES